MPGDQSNTKTSGSAKKRGTGSRGIPRVRSHPDSDLQNYYRSHDTVLPPQFRARLQEWFVLIEREFEALYSQNLSLEDKVATLTERLEAKDGERSTTDSAAAPAASAVPVQLEPVLYTHTIARPPKQLPPPQQLKSVKIGSSSKTKAAAKLRVQTSRIVSSFKTSPVTCRLNRQYLGHRDGVWDVDAVQRDVMLLATASADQTARIWGAECGRVVLQYTGHSGSVNSVKFHPTRELALTASGDHTAHVWQAAVSHDHLRVASSEDEVEGSGGEEDEDNAPSGDHRRSCSTLRTPLLELRGHTGVVSAAAWLPSGDQVLTASWDRLACIYDATTGHLISQLPGHDRELTHCCCHPMQRLVATASKDTTFRLYDSRDHRHTVSVFQGHTESVTSVCFTRGDKVVSGSDDRSVKVWDVKNMRSPIATIRLDSPVNRLAVSPSGAMIAIPHDNRQVRLYDLTGQRLARLPHNSRQGHRRMVCAVAWVDDSNFNLQNCSAGNAATSGINTGSSAQSSVIGGGANSGSMATSGKDHSSLSGSGIGGADSGSMKDSASSGGGGLSNSLSGFYNSTNNSGGLGQSCMLYTAGFDRAVLGWEVTPAKDKE